MTVRLADSSNHLEPGSADPDGRRLTLDAGQLRAVLRRQRRIFALWVALGLAAGLAYLATTPDSFRAQATVLLTGEANASIDQVSTVENDVVTAISIENAVQVLSSQQIAADVVERLALVDDPRLLNERPSGLSVLIDRAKGLVRGVLGFLASPAADDATPTEPAAEAAQRQERVAYGLRDRVRIFRVGQSSAIAIAFEAQSPDLAADVVNAYVQAYTDDIQRTNRRINEEAAAWLSERLAGLNAEVQDALTAVERFRAENNLVQSSEGLVSEDSVVRLNDEYSTALADQARSRALVAAYESALALGPEALDDRSADILLPAGTERLVGLQQEYAALTARRDEVVESFGADHPEAVRLQAEAQELSDLLFAEIRAAAAAAQGDLDVATARVAALQETLGGAVATNAAASEARVKLRSLEQRAEAVSTLYETLLVQAERANQQRTLPVSSARVLSLAPVPRQASSPSTTRTLGLMVVLGLMAATLHAALREGRDLGVRTAADVTDRLGQRFLGYLPTLPSRNGAGTGASPSTADGSAPGFVVLGEPGSPFAETLRNIRLASDLAWGGPGGRVLGITSVRPGEGKSTVSVNLAAILASGGRDVLLIDTDLRKAEITRRLGLGRKPGLRSLALSGAPFASAMTRIEGTTISVLGAEGPQEGATAYDILSSPRLHDLLDDARSAFRYIVLDLAPLSPIVDARLLLPTVDQAVLVTEWGQTPRPLVLHALRETPQLTARLLGMVLNRVDLAELRQYAGPGKEPSYEAYYRADDPAGR